MRKTVNYHYSTDEEEGLRRYLAKAEFALPTMEELKHNPNVYDINGMYACLVLVYDNIATIKNARPDLMRALDNYLIEE